MFVVYASRSRRVIDFDQVSAEMESFLLASKPLPKPAAMTGHAGHATRKGAVHEAGVTRLVYSPEGDRLYTGGSDSFVRAWKGDPASNADDSTYIIDHHMAPILALDASVRLRLAKRYVFTDLNVEYLDGGARHWL